MRSITTFLLAFLLISVSACDSGGSNEPPPNEAPSVDFSFSPQSPRAGTTVNFTANASDSDGEVTKYSWDFDGDGTQDASGPNPSHTFQEQGSFSVSLTVTDDSDDTASASQTVSVEQRYTQVTITEVTVEDMPFTNDSGQGWDSFTGPELYYIAADESDEIAATSTYISDVGPDDLPVTLTGGEFTITDLSEDYSIFLYDSDNSADEYIGGIGYSYDNLIGDYPDTYTLDAGAGVTLEVALEWGE